MLKPNELTELRPIFMDGFVPQEFRTIVRDLGKHAADHPDFEQVLALTFDKANRYGWLRDVVYEALKANPSLGELYAFAQEHFAFTGVAGATRDQLERLIDETNASIDILVLLSRVSTIYRQVCRISFGNGATPIGSGFLIGPSAVMTNYHVMQRVIEGPVKPEEVRVQFDFATKPSGEIDNGTLVKLTSKKEQWLIDRSENTEWDRLGTGDPPTKDQLDYAVIRLDRDIGKQPVRATVDPDAKVRSWIDITKHGDLPAADTPVYIVQHPKGSTMKFAWQTKSAIGPAGNGNRFRHRTNTEKGSSGSPTFNGNWDLIALHNSGDPDFTHPAGWNQGIPMKLIVDRLGAAKLAEIAN
jgi:V8-like Glu-specific endopeptidase